MNEEDKDYFEEMMTKDVSYQLMINLVDTQEEPKMLHNILIQHGLGKMAAYHAVIQFMNDVTALNNKKNKKDNEEE